MQNGSQAVVPNRCGRDTVLPVVIQTGDGDVAGRELFNSLDHIDRAVTCRNGHGPSAELVERPGVHHFTNIGQSQASADRSLLQGKFFKPRQVGFVLDGPLGDLPSRHVILLHSRVDHQNWRADAGNGGIVFHGQGADRHEVPFEPHAVHQADFTRPQRSRSCQKSDDRQPDGHPAGTQVKAGTADLP